MIIDQTKVSFYSSWDIDKLLASGQATVTVPSYPSAATQVADLTSYGFSQVHKIIGLISFDSGVNWYLSGGGLFATHPIYLTATTSSLAAAAWDIGATVLIKYWIFNSTVAV